MRYLLFLLALAFAAPVTGQIYIDSYRFGSADLLLDSFPGAAGAWSFRLLDKDYTGNAIMVQRQSDNDSSNIGFVSGYLDTATLKTFCASTNCGVRTWYDQSGNGRHARRSTLSQMPRIIDNGVIVRSGSVPVMRRDSQSLILPQNIGLASQSIFSGFALNINIDETTAAISLYVADSTTQTNSIAFGSSTGSLTNERIAWLTGTSAPPTLQLYGSGELSTNISSGNHLLSALFDQPNATTQLYRNNTLLSLSNVPNGAFTSSIYPRSWNFVRDANINNARNSSLFEIIVYPTYESANRAAIENNINNFYSIY